MLNKLINELKQQGIDVVADDETRFKLRITTDTPGQCVETAIGLLELLKEHESQIPEFLNGGNEMTITVNVNINASPELMCVLQSFMSAHQVMATVEPVAQTAAPVVATPVMQQPAPITAPPITAPPVTAPAVAAPSAVPTAVPTATQAYTMEQLAVAATQLVDAGRRQELVNLLTSFGVQALTALPKEQYGNFATQLRTMGAKL